MASSARLSVKLASLRGTVFATDQPFVVAPMPETDWEHALDALNAVIDAGYTRVRFARPGAGGVSR